MLNQLIYLDKLFINKISNTLWGKGIGGLVNNERIPRYPTIELKTDQKRKKDFLLLSEINKLLSVTRKESSS